MGERVANEAGPTQFNRNRYFDAQQPKQAEQMQTEKFNVDAQLT